MSEKSQVVPISDSISKALERLFKIGGFALAFGFGGLFLIIAASLIASNDNQLKIPMFVAGCVLTFLCLAFFFFNGRRTQLVSQRIKEDLPLLDCLQDIALKLTDLAGLTQSVAFKHLSSIQNSLEVILPLIEQVPVIGLAAKTSGLTNSAKVSDLIVDTTEKTKQIIRDIEDAIRAGDLKRLNDYSIKLEEVVKNLRVLLRT